MEIISPLGRRAASGPFHTANAWSVRVVFIVFAIAPASLALTFPHPMRAQAATAVVDQILIRPNSQLTETGVQAVVAAHGASQIDLIPELNVRVLRVPSSRRDGVIEAMHHNPNIEFAEVNGLANAGALTNDPEVMNGHEWHLSTTQAGDAWGVTGGNASTIIAICDTGVAPTQPDLMGKLLPGYNFYANNTDSSDDYGHGTAVAGTAAAQGNNGLGWLESPGAPPSCQSKSAIRRVGPLTPTWLRH